MRVKFKKNERIDQLYSNNVSIIQSNDVFSFSLDAVLLAEFAQVGSKRVKNIIDLCSGNGAVGLFLSSETSAQITMVEIQEKLADMAARSIQLNHLENQVHVVNDDLKNTTHYISKDSVDVIVCNPPYFVNYETSEKNPNQYLAIARHEIKTTIDEITKISADLLKTNAKLFVVYRPDRLTDLLLSLRNHHLEPKILQFVRSKTTSEANMVLVEAIKSGKPNGLRIQEDLITHEGNDYSGKVKRILYGETN